jgi:spoIIIJ-associated protein
MEEKYLTEIEQLVGKFVELLGIKSEVNSSFEQDGDRKVVTVNIKGEDLSDVIGYHGKNLESLQKLINISYNRGRDEFVNIVLDINEYREKRVEYLKSVTERALIQVRESSQSLTLPPMKASERRIVHMILQDESDVVTESEGEEPNRSIVIKPKN